MEEKLYNPTQPEQAGTPDEPLYRATEEDESAPISEDVAVDRTKKYHFGMGKDSPGEDQIFESLRNGKENNVRGHAALSREMEIKRANMRILSDFSERFPDSTLDERQAILDLTEVDHQNPESILEKLYARNTLAATVGINNGQKLYAEAAAEDPDAADASVSAAETMLTIKEGFQKRAEDLEARYQKRDYFNTAVDYAATFIPFWSWSAVGNEVEGAPYEFWPGNSIQEQRQYLMDIALEQGPDVAFKMLDDALGEMYEFSPLDAMHFAQAMTQYAGSDEALDNAFAVMEVATLPVAGTLATAGRSIRTASKAARGASAIKGVINRGKSLGFQPKEKLGFFQRALKDAVKGVRNRTASAEEQMAASGNIREAAAEGATRRMQGAQGEYITSARYQGEPGEIGNLIPTSLSNPRVYNNHASSFSREETERIVHELQNNAEAIWQAVSNGNKIDRLTDEARDEMLRIAQERVRQQYPHLNDRTFDVVPVRSEDNVFANVDVFAIRMSDENGELFSSAQEATLQAEAWGLKKTRVKQQGNGFYIELTETVDESTPRVRSLIQDTDNPTPQSLGRQFFNYLAGADENIAKGAQERRIVATYGIQRHISYVKQVAGKIGALPKKSRNRLLEMLDDDRTFQGWDASTNETFMGREAADLKDFSSRWQEKFGQPPTEKEAVAYFSYRQLNDMDYLMRNSHVYAGKAREGIKSWDITTANDVIKGIEGKEVKELPAGERIGLVAFDETGNVGFFRMGDTSAAGRDSIKRKLEGGYRLIELKPFGQATIKRNEQVADLIGNDKAHYILVRPKDVKEGPLKLQQIPRRPGGHLDYTDAYYVRQGRVTRVEDNAGNLKEHRYDGDVNIWSFTSEKKAARFATRLEKARQLLKAGDDQAADAYISSNLPKSPEAIRSLFNDGVLDIDTPIQHSFSGERLGDKYGFQNTYEKFYDDANDPIGGYQSIDLSLTGKRDPLIETFEETGSEEAPIFKSKPARLFDPLTTMDRSMTKLVESEFFQEVRMYEAANFFNEFKDILSVPQDELFNRPMHYIFRDDLFLPGADPRRLAAAKASLRALKQFVGVQNTEGKTLHYLKQKLLNSLDSLPEGKAREVLENWAGYTTKDPFTYFRSMAFHIKLGLFNPVQLFLQTQTYFHTAAVIGNPKITAQATAASMYMRLMRGHPTPENLNEAARRMRAFGWDPEDFKEAYTEFERSGMHWVGGEVAVKDDFADPKFITTRAGKFLDFSRVFFDEGERMVRYNAFNSAYLEWRAANPGVKINNKIRGQIIKRADNLSLNMTRASNASWQQGFASLGTQFYAYHARLAEQMLGKKLTLAEKGRVLAMYSALYGVPVAAAGTTAVWPWGDSIRAELIERGINYDDNVVSRVLMDGVVSAVLQAGTGTKYNVGERYGPGGLSIFRDVLKGDKEWYEAIHGVSGTVASDVITSIHPLLKDTALLLKGEPGALKITMADLQGAFQNISTANQAVKGAFALRYGQLMSRNETNLGSVEPEAAALQFFSGLSPQEISDSFTKMDVMKEWDNEKTKAMKEATKWGRKAVRAYAEGEQELGMLYDKSMFLAAYGVGLTPQEQALLLRNIYSNTSLEESVGLKFEKEQQNRQAEKVVAEEIEKALEE